MLTRTASRISVPFLLCAAALLLVVSPTMTVRVAAAPGAPDVVLARAQNVDWMSAEQAAALDLSIPVMVPTFIPAPFSGSTAISGDGGYYSLYWVNYGGPPTFLHITGDAGGSLPAGSPADLNVELSVNASVQGSEAIHDVTAIYDNVWWVSGGVLYTVSSNNMTGTDSLSLANSLIALDPPDVTEPEPEPEPDPPSPDPTLAPPDPSQNDQPAGSEPDPEQSTGSSEQPVEAVDDTEVVTETEVDDGAGETDETLPEDAASPGSETSVDLTDSLVTSLDVGAVVPGTFTMSDGTGGAALPTGGDGTGGIWQVAVP